MWGKVILRRPTQQSMRVRSDRETRRNRPWEIRGLHIAGYAASRGRRARYGNVQNCRRPCVGLDSIGRRYKSEIFVAHSHIKGQTRIDSEIVVHEAAVIREPPRMG